MVVIDTKLHIPRVHSDLISRPHLMEKLDRGLGRKITLITAPPGYGKTTILSEWTREISYPVAWVSLDDRDNNYLQFWKLVIASLHQEVPEFDGEAVLQFAASDHSGEALVAALINGLNRLSESLVIVWDDFHNIEDSSILNGVSYLVKRLPPHIHLFISSRVPPSLSLSKVRASGELNVLEVEDLRFEPKEVIAFFDSLRDLVLSSEEKSVLLEQTEGWITGMRLASLYLNTQTDREVITERTLGKHQDISDYFLEEVFNDQTEEMQDFLLKISLFDQMNVEFCQEVTGISRSSEYFLQLKQMNLFLVSLDKEQKWYRYHHLFRDFLRTKVSEHPVEQVQVLRTKAGKWYEENQFLHEAVEQYLTGKQYKDALRLLEKIAPKLIDLEFNTLQRWFDLIPNSLLLENPLLLMNDILSSFMLGKTESAKKKLNKALSKSEKMPTEISESVQTEIHGSLMMLQFIGAFFEKDFETAIRFAEDYVRSYPDGEFFIGLGMEGDLEIQHWSILETVESLTEREDLFRRLLAIWSTTKQYYIVAESYIGYGEVLYEWNRLEEAEDCWTRAKQISEEHDNQTLSTISNLLLAKIYAVKGQLDKAENILVKLNAGMDQDQYPQLYQFYIVYEAYTKSIWGGGKETLKWLEYCELQVTDEIPSTMPIEYNVFASALVELGKKEEAVTLLGRLVRVAKRSGRKSDYIRLLTQKSLLLEQLGKRTRSLEVLEEALALAEPDQYIRTFLDAGKPCMELLAHYLEGRQKQHIRPNKKVSLAYVKKLLTLNYFSVKEAASTLKEYPDHIVLTEQEMVVLQFIAKDFSNREISNALNIALSTVKTHINNVYGKLQVNNRMEALERARQLKLI